MANLRLRRLKIEKFRNVVPGTELVFGDGMNVLLGRNGTGKTTLLQLQFPGPGGRRVRDRIRFVFI
jgi:recombinational DNA repair ATPase RecF